MSPASSFAVVPPIQHGVDLASPITEVGAGYVPASMNFQISKLGGAEKILGYSAFATIAANVQAVFSFERTKPSVRDRIVAATATTWYEVDSGGTPTAIRSTMTSNTTASFCQVGDVLYGLDEANIMASWDGTTLTTFAVGASTGPPLGRILGVWNGRMYVVTAADPMKVVFSDAYNFTSWPANNYAQLSGQGEGGRVQGAVVLPDGVLVFSDVSIYRIYDDGGSFVVVDPSIGCTSGASIAYTYGQVYAMSSQGVYRTNGSAPAQVISLYTDPLYSAGTPTLSNAAGLSYQNRYYCTIQRGASNNDTTVETYPMLVPYRQRAYAIPPVMLNQYPAYRWVTSKVADTLTPHPYFVDASDRTKIRKAFSGGSFAGAAVNCYMETAPTTFGSDALEKRLERVRLTGVGTNVTCGVKVDYAQDVSASTTFTQTTTGNGVWDSSTWDGASWASFYVGPMYARLPARGKAFGFYFAESSTATATGRTVAGSDGGTIGGAAIYEVEARFVGLRRERG